MITLGISGGHTRSQAIATCGLDVIGTAVTEGINDHANMDATIDAQSHLITNGILKLLSNLVVSIQKSGVFLGEIRGWEDLCQLADEVVIAMPGVTTQYDRDRISFPLKKFGFKNLTIVDDTWAVLIAGLRSKRGISAIAGTGASVYLGVDYFRLDKRFKLDGFGAILGDWGSGFRLAVRLLEEAGRMHDRGERIELADRLITFANKIHRTLENPLLESMDNLQNWFDDLVRTEPTRWRTVVAQLAEVATRAAEEEEGCELARRLVKNSSVELAETITTGLMKLRTMDDLPSDLSVEEMPVVCKGGQLEHSKLYRSHLVETLRDSGFEGPVVFSEFGPAVGAAIMSIAAQYEIEITPDAVELKKFCDSVRSFESSKADGLYLGQMQ